MLTVSDFAAAQRNTPLSAWRIVERGQAMFAQVTAEGGVELHRLVTGKSANVILGIWACFH
jgi:hypothetical protein